MSGQSERKELWEGWEASEERQEAEEGAAGVGNLHKKLFVAMGVELDPEILGVLWLSRPHPDGLDGVGGGLLVTTPRGKKVMIGVDPNTVTKASQARLAEVADKILEQVEREKENEEQHYYQQRSWLHTILHAVRAFMEQQDQSTLWKIASVLLDYERSMDAAEKKGYDPSEWSLQSLLALLPDNTEGRKPS